MIIMAPMSFIYSTKQRWYGPGDVYEVLASVKSKNYDVTDVLFDAVL